MNETALYPGLAVLSVPGGMCAQGMTAQFMPFIADAESRG